MKNKIYNKQIDVEYFKFEDGVIVTKLGNSYELNDVAHDIFLAINGENSVATIVNTLAEKYDGDRQKMEADVIKLCQRMLEAEVIEEVR